jgi:type II secretory pathway pseudopilin PulG
MSLLELVIVVALIATMSALALGGITEAVERARYRADRARFFLLVREARDRSAGARRAVRVDAAANTLTVRHFAGACPGVGLPVATATHTFSVLTATPATTCFDAGSVAVPTPLVVTGPDAVPDAVTQQPDGRLDDSWGEFPTEGALDTGACDTDNDTPCGA